MQKVEKFDETHKTCIVCREKDKRYRQNNKEKVSEREQQYKANNLEKVKEWRQNSLNKVKDEI